MHRSTIGAMVGVVLALANPMAWSAALEPATAAPVAARETGNYKNFRVAIYVTRDTTAQWANPQTLQAAYDNMIQQVKFDKIYLEFATARQMVNETTLDPIKKFFNDKGIPVSAATALNGGGQRGPTMGSLSYVSQADRDYVKAVAEAAARHFDELMLDDWFFTASKTTGDIAAKGNKSWTQYRLEALDEASQNLLLKPGKAINPKFRIIIKYPNWYEHYQALGYDLDVEPKIFDAIYTGVETRDPIVSEQHLQQYESYSIMRYLENVKPGGNAGAWVDQLDTQYIDRYVEQIWDMAFAKPKEITLWQWSGAARPINVGARPWEKTATSFDYQKMVESYKGTNQPMTGHVASYALEQVDAILNKLGKPIGIAAYRPPHAIGDEFLHDYLGMIGIPIDLRPAFPEDASTCLLTEGAKNDPEIVSKIKKQLVAGKNVVVTSGLLRALSGKGIEDISEFEYTDRKVGATAFHGRRGRPIAAGETLSHPVFFPVIHFITNQSWGELNAFDESAPQNAYPIVLSDVYGQGTLYVLAIPDNVADLYRLPGPVLGAIRNFVMGEFPVRLEDAPGQVALFAYDNNTFIVESYLPTETTVPVNVAGTWSNLTDLVSGESVSPAAAGEPVGGRRGGRGAVGRPRGTSFTVTVPAHSFRALAAGN